MLQSKLAHCSKLVLQGVMKQSGTLATSQRILSKPMSSETSATYTYENLAVSRPRDFVVQVEFNRPNKRNAITLDMYNEITDCFTKLSEDEDCRAVVLTGAGKIFTAGIDVMSLAGKLMEDMDPGRKAFMIKKFVKVLQDSESVMEKCSKPVIAAVHSACIGGGVDIISACDIRYCTQDAYFQIKEVDIGLAADLGTLQRMPKIIGNDSLVRELAYTARQMPSTEAKDAGFVSRIFPDREALLSGALDLAEEISTKSPVAVQGSKLVMNYSRDHSVDDGLEYVATWNMAALQSEDVRKAAMAAMQKEKATFSKL